MTAMMDTSEWVHTQNAFELALRGSHLRVLALRVALEVAAVVALGAVPADRRAALVRLAVGRALEGAVGFDGRRCRAATVVQPVLRHTRTAAEIVKYT